MSSLNITLTLLFSTLIAILLSQEFVYLTLTVCHLPLFEGSQIIAINKVLCVI